MAQVQDLMRTEVIWVKPEDPLHRVYELMQQWGIRHVPVVDQDSILQGIVSEGDVLLQSSRGQGRVLVPSTPVADAMSRDVVSCRPHSRTADVLSTMIQARVDCLPVTRDGSLVGIITDRDFLTEMLTREEREGGPAKPFDYVPRDHSTPTPDRDIYTS